MVIPEDMDLPAVIHDLACQAISVCHSGKGNSMNTHKIVFTTMFEVLYQLLRVWNPFSVRIFRLNQLYRCIISAAFSLFCNMKQKNVIITTDLLLDCLELCKGTRTAMDVYQQCQLSDNYGFIAKVSIPSFPGKLYGCIIACYIVFHTSNREFKTFKFKNLQ